jgi:hypothetical protein
MRPLVLIAAALLAMPALAQSGAERPLGESSASARQSLQRFATCVADRSPDKAAQTLQMNFTTSSYRSALRRLSEVNRDCFSRRGIMRSASLGFAGAMAERLLERDPSPLNVRLARAATMPATPARSVTDAIAICVVRSVPDDVARLFATDIATPAEAAAGRALDVPVRLCSQGKPTLETNIEGLRAMLATAAFRTVAGATGERG